MKEKAQEIIPSQSRGGQSGAKVETTLSTREEAIEKFEQARLRLMSVDCWHKYGGSASFALFNALGERVDRLARKGDFIRIDLPGPGPRAGKGYDWVHIEELCNTRDENHDQVSFAFRVRPSADPRGNKEEKAHFFSDSATSSFLVHRKGKIVIAEEQGRNEEINTHASGLADKVRNTVVGISARAGISHLQWKKLLEGILGK